MTTDITLTSDLIETACHNAVQAMHAEARRAISEQQTPETCLILAAALEAMSVEGVWDPQWLDCVAHLRRQTSPRRKA